MSIGGQITGFVSNARALVGRLRPSNLLPPSIVSTMKFIMDALPRSMGFTDNPGEMFTSAIVFGVFLVIVSFALLTPVGFAWAGFFGAVAVVRLIPVVDKYWPLTEASWPLWDVN